MDLQWNRIDGGFEDRSGAIAAFDPSVNHRGPKALLVRRDHLVTYLRESGQEILWIVTGEKRVISGEFPPDRSLGYLEIMAWYRLLDDGLIGQLRTNLVES